MKVSLLRTFSIVITSLVASSTAFGAMDLDCRVTQLENQMQQVRTETAMGTYGPKTASARPEINGYGWLFAFDVLYWHPKVEGTEFAYTRQSNSMPMKGKIKDLQFNWNWGLRFGLGYNISHDAWDFKAHYTWFDAKAGGATRQGVENSVVPLRASTAMIAGEGKEFTSCSIAKSEFATYYKDLSLELGRAHFMSKYLSFRPHWGIKSARINQSQTIRYSGGDEANGGLGVHTVHVKDRCEFRGLGPRVGLDSKWHLGAGVSLFGNVNGALVFGAFDVDHEEQFSGDPKKHLELNSNQRAFSPTTHMHLGLRYDTYLHNCTQHLGIGLGFEAQHWWKQAQRFKVEGNAKSRMDYATNDLSLYGMTLDVKWSF